MHGTQSVHDTPRQRIGEGTAVVKRDGGLTCGTKRSELKETIIEINGVLIIDTTDSTMGEDRF